MAQLHHTKVKYGVATYSVLHTEGKTADEVKTAIAADEKGFDEDGVNQIYEAIVNPVAKDDKPKDEANAKFYVLKEFRDLNDFSKVHEVEADVSHFGKERLEKLVELGLVEKV